MREKIPYLLVSALILAADQATKYWATASLKPRGWIEVVPGFFRFSYATNRGVAFSLFADSQMNVRWIFGAISTLAAVFVITYLLRAEAAQWLLSASLSLLAAGIVGNLIDRLRLGEVIDFLDFHLGEKYYWPTFNVADAAICVGAVLLALDMLNDERQARSRATARRREVGPTEDLPG